MALPLYLQSIKSSGIYRFVFDKSVSIETQASQLRLVVGFSEKGPFNTPVYVTSSAEFKSIFGGINKKLEKKGIFFHRLALQALEAGPILALNLKKFEDEKVGALPFDTQDAFDDNNIKDIDVRNIFDKNRFWYISKDEIIKSLQPEKYINIVSTNTESTSATIFMRPTRVTGYDITIKEYYDMYSTEDLPDYFINKAQLDKLVNDYFVEVYVFKGEFSKDLVQSKALSQYFDVVGDNVYLKPYVLDAFGNKQDTLEALANYEGSNFVSRYVGSTIPYFKNALGQYAALDIVFNNDNYAHNLYMTFNYDQFNDPESELDITVKNLTVDASANIQDGTIAFGENTLSVRQYTVDATVKGYNNGWETTTEGSEDFTIYSKPADITISEESITPVEFKNNTLEVLKSSTISGEETVNYTYDELGLDVDTVVFVKVGDENKALTVSNIADATEVVTETLTITKKVYTLSDTPAAVASGNMFMVAPMLPEYENLNKLVPTYIYGYKYTSTDLSKSNAEILDTILNVLVDEPGIRLALTDNVSSDYRYIVDSFAGVISRNKSQLAVICKEKKNAFALINFPNIKLFADNPEYQTKGNFDINKITQYALPSDLNGASFCAYYTSLKFRDPDSTTITYLVPSAALVSNLFMNKYTVRLPYNIVAGPNYGRIVEDYLVGPDWNFSRADLDVLEPFGVNAIVYTPQKGTYINSNQTAKQTPVSTLSKINVRELVIYIQDTIEIMLQNYQWEFNTETLRNIIKQKADKILETIKNNGGLYEYITVCDSTNNTDDVINNEMLVLDIHIEPGMGAGKMIQTLTLYKKGGMSSSVVG